MHNYYVAIVFRKKLLLLFYVVEH